MLRSAVLFLIFALPFAANAESLTGHVVHLEDPESDGTHLVFMDSGRVLRVMDREKAAVLEGAMIAGETVNISLVPTSGTDEIVSITSVAESVERSSLQMNLENAYIPTEIPTLEEATHIHRNLPAATRAKSICSNRAHVWAYRMWRDHGVKSMKAFLFFTSRYIRTYRGKWWYHVTPYVHAAGSQYALDRTFFREPKELSAWASHFVKNRFACPYIEKYSEYKDQERTGWCFVRRVPMYAWMPYDVKNMDTQPGATSFKLPQVKQAVRDALTKRARRSFQY